MTRASGPSALRFTKRQPFGLAGVLLFGLFGIGGIAFMAVDKLTAHEIADVDDAQDGVRSPDGGTAALTRPPSPAGATAPQPAAGPTVPPLAQPGPSGAPVPALIPVPDPPGPVGSPPAADKAPAAPTRAAPTPAALTPPPNAAAMPRPYAERPRNLLPPSAETPPLATAATVAPPPAVKPSNLKTLVSLPPDGGEIIHVEFSPGSSALSEEARLKLRALAAEMLESDGRLRLEAFASGDSAGQGRRTSLTRALTVRSYLIEQGLSGTRVDVRALGAVQDGGSEDRVDVVLQSR